MHEMDRNPERIINLMKSAGVSPVEIIKGIQKAIKLKHIKSVKPEHLMINILDHYVYSPCCTSYSTGYYF